STATHTCCLAVVSSPDDPFTNPATDIATLVTGDKRACLKNLHVVDPGSAPVGLTLVGIDFHHAGARAALADLIVRPSLFDRGRIGLLLPAIELAANAGGTTGVERVALAPDDPIGAWYVRGKKASEKQLAERWRGLDRRHIWMFSSTQVSRLAGIPLAAGQTLRGALVCSHKRDVPTPVAPRVTIEQRIGGVSVGGSTFQIGYDGAGSPVQPRPRRIRILADRLQWRGGPGGGRPTRRRARGAIAGDPHPA